MRKKRIAIQATLSFSEELKNILSDYKVEYYDTISFLKEFKPNIVICEFAVEQVIKGITKKTKVIYLSDTSVFTGRDSVYSIYSNPDVENIKVIEEKIVKQRDHSLIIRLSEIITKQYVLDLKQKIENNEELLLDNRTNIFPITINNVISFLKVLIDKDIKGIVHFRGKDQTTYYQIAQTLSKLIGKELKAKSSFSRTTPYSIKKLIGVAVENKVGKIIEEYIS